MALSTPYGAFVRVLQLLLLRLTDRGELAVEISYSVMKWRICTVDGASTAVENGGAHDVNTAGRNR
jgi:hypothetical protein